MAELISPFNAASLECPDLYVYLIQGNAHTREAMSFLLNKASGTRLQLIDGEIR